MVEFKTDLDEILELKNDGAISIELEYSPESSKIDEWIQEAYEATDWLLRESGLRD